MLIKYILVLEHGDIKSETGDSKHNSHSFISRRQDKRLIRVLIVVLSRGSQNMKESRDYRNFKNNTAPSTNGSCSQEVAYL